MQLIYDEIMDKLDMKYFPSKGTGYTLPPGIYEITVVNKTLEYISPDNVKVTITIDEIRLKSNLKINQTLIFTKKSFLYNFRFYSITFLSFKLYRWIIYIDYGII